jgi:hypothetical protein
MSHNQPAIVPLARPILPPINAVAQQQPGSKLPLARASLATLAPTLAAFSAMPSVSRAPLMGLVLSSDLAAMQAG